MRKLADLLAEANRQEKYEDSDRFEEALLFIEARILLIRYLVGKGCPPERFNIENDLLALDIDAIRVYADDATPEQMERLQKVTMAYVKDMIEG